ncbi:CRISPR system precrRNA processing endoribonuclease RAMP protein Cas6 [Candidatus Kuenenbacteria bacterium]|nr:CRISPR system precrRNA processing endoribonuclease RAMP protein Cas6 [Candidatus Kuenenbacteria bacterium]
MFAKLSLEYVASKDISLKAGNKNNLIRSALGATLKRMDEMAYQMFFEGRLFELVGKKERVAMFAPDCQSGQKVFRLGDSFSFGLTLLGANVAWSTYVQAFRAMFLEHGFELKAVWAWSNVSDDNSRELVVLDNDAARAVSELTIENLIDNYRIEQPIRQLQIQLITPLRLVRGAGFVEQPTFADVVFACARRVENIYSTLSIGQAQPPAEFTGLAEASLGINSTSEVVWQDWYRKQSRHGGQSMAMGGVVGMITATCDQLPYLNPFISLLKCGEFLHIGKGITMGNGGIKVSW